MSEQKQIDNPENWRGADFKTLSDYVQDLNLALCYRPALNEILDGLMAPDSPMSLDEKCRILDLIAAKSKLVELESPRGLRIMTASGGLYLEDGNPIPKWCEAQKEIIKSLHHPSAKGAAAPSKNTEPDWPVLYGEFNANKTNPEHWGDFLEVLKDYRQGDAINMARIAWILRAGKYIATPMAWRAWYNLFCLRCGLEPCATYAKDAKKINPSGDATRNIAHKIGESGFLRERRSGEPLNHHHIPIDKMSI